MITLHSDIRAVLSQEVQESSYLMISLDERVLGLLQIPNNSINEDFIDLLKFILPFGICISGVLFLVNTIDIENLHFRAKFILERLSLDISSHLVKVTLEYFRALAVKIGSILDYDVKVDLQYGFLGDLDWQAKKLKAIHKIRFLDLSSVLAKEFIIFHTKPFDLNMIVDSDSNLEGKPGLVDLAIMTNSLSNSIMMDLHEINTLLDLNSSSLETQIRSNLVKTYLKENTQIPIELFIDSTINYNKIDKENYNTSISIHQSKNTSKVKSSRISLCYLQSRDEPISQETLQTIKSYFIEMLTEIHSLNLNSSLAFSLYLTKDNGWSIIPFYLLYSTKDIDEDFEESLFSQRQFFHEVFCLYSNFPKLKIGNLESLKSCRHEQGLKEYGIRKFNQGIYDCELIENLHAELLETELDGFVNVHGDYLYYHVGHGKVNDQVVLIYLELGVWISSPTDYHVLVGS